ncbi:MAG: type II toxin-antitoxin system VapC family toxin [Actinomycetota bacterium]
MSEPILAMDTSALMRRYIPDPHASLVLDAMAGADVWCASELARTEVLMALHRMAMAPFQHEELWRSARADWDAFHVVPVDGRCLSHAADLGATYGLRLTDAIHLAAADRLPRPVQYLTFDRRQIPAAAELGLVVLTPVEAL